MAITEKIGFGVDIDTAEAEAALERLRKESEAVQRNLMKAGSGGSSFASATDKMSSSLKKAEPRIGKVATGVSGLAGTMGGAVGQTNAMTGAVGNLAGAFAGGGLLAVGISVAVVGIGALVEGFTKAKEAAKKLAIETAGLANVSVVSFGGAAAAELETLRKSNRASLGITASMQRRQALGEQVANAEKEFANESAEVLRIEKLLEGHDKGKIWMSTERLRLQKENLEVARAAEDNAQTQLVHLDTEHRNLVEISKEYEAQLALRNRIELAQDKARKKEKAIERWRKNRDKRKRDGEKAAMDALRLLVEMQKIQNDAQKKFDEKKIKDAADKEAAEVAQFDRLFQFEQDIENATEKRREKEAKATQAALRLQVRESEKAEKDKQKAKEETAAKEKAQIEEVTAFAMQAASIGISTSLRLFDAVVTGQQNAIEQLLAAQLKSTGQQVIGIGMKYVAEGIGMSALGAPNGPVVLAAGAAAVATGVAMAGGGTVWSHLAAGGQVGKALPTASDSKGGSGVGDVRTNTTNAAAAPTSTSNTYVFNGPTYDAIGTTRHISTSRELESDLLQAQP